MPISGTVGRGARSYSDCEGISDFICGYRCGDKGIPLARTFVLWGEFDAPSEASASKDVGVKGGEEADVEARRRDGEADGRP